MDIGCYLCFLETKSLWGCFPVGADPRHLKARGRAASGMWYLSTCQPWRHFSQCTGWVWCGCVCHCCRRANQSSTPWSAHQPQRTCSCWAKSPTATGPRSHHTKTSLKAELNALRKAPRTQLHPLCPLIRLKGKGPTFPLCLNQTSQLLLKAPDHPLSLPRISPLGCGRILCRASPLTAPAWL